MNAIKTIQPMLANKVTNVNINYNELVFIQPKLDGIRCVVTKDGCYTRTGNEIKNVEHINKALAPLLARQPHLILDGELYNHDLKDDFGKIISLCRKQTPSEDDIKASKELIQFHWYDIICDGKQELRDRLRRTIFLAELKETGPVRFVWSQIVKSDDDVSAIHRAYLAEGYEGSILRLNKDYECKRSKNLLKVKDFHDKEATIIKVLPSKKIDGAVEKFVMKDDDGMIFGCPLGKFTHAQRRDIWTNRDKYINQRGTFEYFQRTQYGSYRHPLFKALRNYE